VRETVAELAALMDGAGRFRGNVAPDMAGKGKLLEEFLHPFGVLALVRVDLGVGAFEIRRPQHARRAVTRPSHENHVEIMPDDHAVKMNPHERQRRARSPVAKEPVLYVFGLQRFLQQRVILEVDHPHRKVIARSPIGIHQFQLFVA